MIYQDYYAIAEEFGTMEEFDELLAESKKRGISIIMDLVINHCSDKHEWFKKALADPDGEYADYFFFREGKKRQSAKQLSLLFWRQLLGNQFQTATNIIYICLQKSSLI